MKPRSDGYTAGILDGEGCCSIATYTQKVKKAGKVYSYLNTQAATSIFNTDRRLIDWLMHHYGGRNHLTRPKKGKIGWAWYPPISNLEQFLLAIIPHLLLKKEQALLVLEYIRLGHGKPGPGITNRDLQKKRQELARRCSILNQKESPEANTSSTSPEVKIESELIGDDESAVVVTQTA